jgi:hypothetical protein
MTKSQKTITKQKLCQFPFRERIVLTGVAISLITAIIWSVSLSLIDVVVSMPGGVSCWERLCDYHKNCFNGFVSVDIGTDFGPKS